MNVEQIIQMGETYPAFYPILIIVATFILEDPTTIAVGLLISNHKISYEMGLFSLIAGVFLGDLGLYGLGQGIRNGFFKTRKSYFAPGVYTIALARFIPGMRTVTFLSAGFSRFEIIKFMCIIFPSAIVWTLLILAFTNEMMGAFSSLPSWLMWVCGSCVLGLIQIIGRRLRA